MILDINDKYKIVSDEKSFTIVEKGIIQSGDNKGQPTESNIAFLPNLNMCFKYLLDLVPKKSSAVNDLKQVLQEVRAMKADIDKVLEPLRTDIYE